MGRKNSLNYDLQIGPNGTYETPLPAGMTVAVGGTIFDHFVDAGNVTTGETDLYSDTIPAGMLAVNGDKFHAIYSGVTVSSATATRRLRVYFAGTAIFDTAALVTASISDFVITVDIIRVSATVVRYSISIVDPGLATQPLPSIGELTGLTLSNTNILKLTGQAGSTGAATNDIVAKMGYVQYLPAIQ